MKGENESQMWCSVYECLKDKRSTVVGHLKPKHARPAAGASLENICSPIQFQSIFKENLLGCRKMFKSLQLLN